MAAAMLELMAKMQTIVALAWGPLNHPAEGPLITLPEGPLSHPCPRTAQWYEWAYQRGR